MIRSAKKWTWSQYIHEVYRSKRDVVGAKNFKDKIKIIFQIINVFFFNKRTILFYPDMPKKLFVIYKIAVFLGYKLTSDPSIKADIIVKWRNSMDGNPLLPPEPVLQKIAQNSTSTTLINMECNDVSKERVGKIFEQTFGYSLSVDPENYAGKCVMKSDWNGLHIGEVIDCPTKKRKNNFVYQKLINNEINNEFVEDIRVPIFKNTIPFVYLKHRPINQRLVDRKHSNKKVAMTDVDNVLSQLDINNILSFCQNMGLDYGEVDVLRNKEDGKIYIVDVNNNPAGPPEPISKIDSNKAINRLSQAFEEAFS